MMDWARGGVLLMTRYELHLSLSHECSPFRRLTVILRGAPVRRDTTAVGGRRKKDTIDLENLIGVGPSEKRLKVNHATLLTEYVAFVPSIIVLLTIWP
jgi:hypothetical protein